MHLCCRECMGHDIPGMIMADKFQIVIGSPTLACLILLCNLKALLPVHGRQAPIKHPARSLLLRANKVRIIHQRRLRLMIEPNEHCEQQIAIRHYLSLPDQGRICTRMHCHIWSVVLALTFLAWKDQGRY